jgi:FixJ family two-component response regulator
VGDALAAARATVLRSAWCAHGGNNAIFRQILELFAGHTTWFRGLPQVPGFSPQIVELRRSQMNKRDVDTDRALVLIVDDDEAVRLAIQELLQSVGLDTACFGSTQELLDSALYERPGCLVLDVRLPGLSGLDFQRHLISSGKIKPIVFLTGHGDIPMSVQAMKAGAVDFLTKPFRDQSLLDAVKAGIERDVAQRTAARIVQQHLDRFETLTARERQVLREVANGRLNKQIAFDFGISEVTVKLHRSNVMRKMHAASVGGLIRAWETLPTGVRDNGGHLDHGVVTT